LGDSVSPLDAALARALDFAIEQGDPVLVMLALENIEKRRV